MNTLMQLRSLDGPFASLRSPGRWFWLALFIGALLRMHLVFFTQGTLDVLVWEGHARELSERGLLAYYHGGTYTFNHPPLIGLLFEQVWQIAEAVGIPFRVLLRLPFALLDLGTTFALIALVSECRDATLRRSRFVVGAIYWLCPISIIFSSHHGNTDSSVAFFLTTATLMVSRHNVVAAGVLLGVSLWIKIPGILALPALAFALPSWRERARFAAVTAATGALTYLPWLFQDARAVIDSVFLYSGLRIQTTTGGQIWGVQIFYPKPLDLPFAWRQSYQSFVDGYYRWNTFVTVIPILIVAWARREERSAEGLSKTVAISFSLLYGLSNFWAFQYLAWSLPFWLLSGSGFAIGAVLLGAAYVYGLYAWLCGDWMLMGPWDFIGKPDWPLAILLLRNAAVLFFLGSSIYFLFASTRKEISRWRGRC